MKTANFSQRILNLSPLSKSDTFEYIQTKVTEIKNGDTHLENHRQSLLILVNTISKPVLAVGKSQIGLLQIFSNQIKI